MNITSAEFFCSYSSLSGLPADGLSEIVFVERSNVGKLSLLNSICGCKGLAKTSSRQSAHALWCDRFSPARD